MGLTYGADVASGSPFGMTALSLLAELQDWDGILLRTEAAADPALLRMRRWALAMTGRLAEARDLAERLATGPDGGGEDWYRLAQIGFAQEDAVLLRRAGEEVMRLQCDDIRLRSMLALADLSSKASAAGFGAGFGAGSADNLAGSSGTGGAAEGRRLHIAWLLPAYRPMNGPHPLLLPLLYSGGAYDVVPARRPTASVEELRRRYETLLPRLASATGLGFWALARALAERAALMADPADILDFDAEFHHTAPLASGEKPWLFHFEQINTLFMLSKYWPRLEVREGDAELGLLRGLLKDGSCRLIVSHVRESVRRLVELTDQDVAAKTRYVPLRFPGRPRRRFKTKHRRVNLLFSASFTQNSLLFHARGGLDVVHALLHLLRRRPNVRATFRLPVPTSLPPFLIRRLRAHPQIIWLDKRLTDRQMGALLRQADITLLPSVTLHALTLVQALRAGNVVVGADGYGVREFLRHGRNALIVQGRGPTRFGAEGVRFSEDSLPIIRARRFPADLGFHIRFRTALDQLLRNGRLRRHLALQADSDGRWRYGGGDWTDEVRTLAESALQAG